MKDSDCVPLVGPSILNSPLKDRRSHLMILLLFLWQRLKAAQKDQFQIRKQKSYVVTSYSQE